VQTSVANDGAIETAVRAQLADFGACSIRELGILAIAGRIRLCGEAPSYEDKKRAGQITSHVAGVRRVINQLRVMPT
jgi:osmotically-inducible protein OsmY